jgi:hypothetical protein
MAKRRIYIEKEKRLSTSYLRLLIILDFWLFSEWSLCPGGRYAPGYTVDTHDGVLVLARVLVLNWSGVLVLSLGAGVLVLARVLVLWWYQAGILVFQSRVLVLARVLVLWWYQAGVLVLQWAIMLGWGRQDW